MINTVSVVFKGMAITIHVGDVAGDEIQVDRVDLSLSGLFAKPGRQVILVLFPQKFVIDFFLIVSFTMKMF